MRRPLWCHTEKIAFVWHAEVKDKAAPDLGCAANSLFFFFFLKLGSLLASPGVGGYVFPRVGPKAPL